MKELFDAILADDLEKFIYYFRIRGYIGGFMIIRSDSKNPTNIQKWLDNIDNAYCENHHYYPSNIFENSGCDGISISNPDLIIDTIVETLSDISDI